MDQSNNAVLESPVTSQAPVAIVNDEVFADMCEQYARDRKVIDALRATMKSENVESLTSYLDGFRERIVAFHAIAHEIVKHGRGYTPRADWGFGGQNSSEVAGAILGARTTDSALRTLAAKVTK